MNKRFLLFVNFFWNSIFVDSFVNKVYFKKQQQYNRDVSFSFILNEKSPEVIATELWVERVVIGLDLCPWARPIFQQNQLKFTEFQLSKPLKLNVVENYENSRYDQLVACHDFSLHEINQLINLKSQNSNDDSYNNNNNNNNMNSSINNNQYVSTIIILPDLTDFELFLDLVDKIESTLESLSLTEYIQIATFHPKYKFENSKNTDVENYTNRSPYPLIHLLRVKDVTIAINKYNGETNKIYEKNIETMQTIGLQNMKNILKQINQDSAIS